MTDREFTDEQILAYEKTLKEDELTPNVTSLIPLTLLAPEYVHSVDALKQKTAILFDRYSSYRKIKRDGNCFYRAFSFALAELLTTQPGTSEASRIRIVIEESKEILTGAGYEMLAIEDFYDETVGLIKAHESIDALTSAFCEGYTSDATVCYLRLMCAACLKMNRDFYSMFVEMELDAFIATQVEPTDNIQIVALADLFKVKITIVTLDASANLSAHELATEIIPESLSMTPSTPNIQLFFKPGHYDLIYC